MNKAGKILSVNPLYAIPGGEVIIDCEGFTLDADGDYGCFFGGQRAHLVGTSPTRIVAIVPDTFDQPNVEIYLESGGQRSDSATIIVGQKLAGNLHIVANPAVDPKDDSIIVTRSGARGQTFPVTLFRLESDGYVHEMSAEILNPTGVAFDSRGELFVTNRADGEVCQITKNEDCVQYAANLGTVTGIAFDKSGWMYVGDRTGTIYRISEFGIRDVFAKLEPSVSAYHLAFDNAGNLCVAAPGLASFDSVYLIDKEGVVRNYYRGLGRPQGLAFDKHGNLYVAACLRGRRGIVRITTDNQAGLFVAGMNVIGLCFNKKGEMIVATHEDVYKLPTTIFGNIL